MMMSVRLFVVACAVLIAVGLIALPRTTETCPPMTGAAARDILPPAESAQLRLEPAPVTFRIGTGTTNPDGTPRIYRFKGCNRNFTLADLQTPFAAHQVEWCAMGKAHAWWSVDTQFPKTRDISPELMQRFYDSGVNHVREVKQALAQAKLLLEITGDAAGLPSLELFAQGKAPQLDPQRVRVPSANKPLRVLDFGCGLGRLAAAFARDADFRDVFCVDQSVWHLWTARKALQTILQPSEMNKIRFIVSTPDLISSVTGVAAYGTEPIDLVHSVIVMQHMITPLQYSYLEQMCDLLRVGGAMWVQVVTQRPGSNAYVCDDASVMKSIERGGMQMHVVTIEAAEERLRNRGCNPTFYGTAQRHTGSADVAIIAKKE